MQLLPAASPVTLMLRAMILETWRAFTGLHETDIMYNIEVHFVEPATFSHMVVQLTSNRTWRFSTPLSSADSLSTPRARTRDGSSNATGVG